MTASKNNFKKNIKYSSIIIFCILHLKYLYFQVTDNIVLSPLAKHCQARQDDAYQLSGTIVTLYCQVLNS